MSSLHRNIYLTVFYPLCECFNKHIGSTLTITQMLIMVITRIIISI